MVKKTLVKQHKRKKYMYTSSIDEGISNAGFLYGKSPRDAILNMPEKEIANLIESLDEEPSEFLKDLKSSNREAVADEILELIAESYVDGDSEPRIQLFDISGKKPTPVHKKGGEFGENY